MVYQYTQFERIIMAIINSLSNLPIGPTIFLIKYYRNEFSYYMGYFSMVVSIMYHLGESLDVKIFLEQLKWHELDNIGAMYAFSQLSLPLTKLCRNKKYLIIKGYITFFVILLFQQRGPWVLTNTILPLVLDFSLSIIQMIKYGIPDFNKNTLKKALVFMLISLFFFYKGLDDLNDYLRIWHSLWHISIGITSFYLLQIQEPNFMSLKKIIYFYFDIKEDIINKDVEIKLSANKLLK